MQSPHQLILLRHAKTEAGHDSMDDHERRLTDRGMRDAASVGRWLAEQDCIPEAILCSTATRVQQTVEGIIGCWNREVPISSDRQLYLASPEKIVTYIQTDAPEVSRLLVVGHNPGLEILAGHYSGACGHFPTAAALVLQFDLSAWTQLTLSSNPEVIGSRRI
ncbi:MAG: histidine phosphatase family protein [Pirellulaceae bacterium]